MVDNRSQKYCEALIHYILGLSKHNPHGFELVFRDIRVTKTVELHFHSPSSGFGPALPPPSLLPEVIVDNRDELVFFSDVDLDVTE